MGKYSVHDTAAVPYTATGSPLGQLEGAVGRDNMGIRGVLVARVSIVVVAGASKPDFAGGRHMVYVVEVQETLDELGNRDCDQRMAPNLEPYLVDTAVGHRVQEWEAEKGGHWGGRSPLEFLARYPCCNDMKRRYQKN